MLGGWVKAQGGDKGKEGLTREDVDRLGAAARAMKR